MENHQPGRQVARPAPGTELGRFLRELPPAAASRGFTRRVLERLEAEGWQEPRAGHDAAPRLALAAAALAASLAIAIGLPRLPGPPAARRAAPVARAPVAGTVEGAAPAAQVERPVAAAAGSARLPDSPEGVRAAQPPAAADADSDVAGIATGRIAETARAHQLLRQLRDESGRLERELQDLRQAQPEVVYLGGDDELDLVLDLSRVREGRRVLPATHHHGTL